jgi:hypothetical protein
MLYGGICPCSLLRELRWRGELRVIPTAAESSHELDGRGHLRNLRIDQRLLVGQQGSLRNDHIDIRIDAGLVPAHFKVQIGLRGPNGLLLPLYLLR